VTRRRHPTLERIVRRLKPSAESFAAAAAVHAPDLLLHLQLEATPGFVEGDARSRDTRPAASDRPEWQECPAR
jgi:hypothetical protein